jgi:CarD family transcriptional regulator
MRFTAGQTVIHPHHGPATVIEVFDRTMKGEVRHYLGLEAHRSTLRVAVPVEKVDEVGLRRVASETQARELLEVLRGPSDVMEETWSRRFKANQEKLRLGNLLVTAGVVRDLMRREAERGLSAGEKGMLRHAEQPVLAELALSLSLADGDVEDLLRSTVLGDQRAPAPALPTASWPSLLQTGRKPRTGGARCQASADPDLSRISRDRTPERWAPWGSNPQPAD